MCFKSDKLKKSVFLFLTLFLFIIISCSGPDSIVIQEDAVNLKNIATSYEKGITWTEEIEKEKLNQKIPSVDGIEKSVKVTPINILFSREEEFVEPLYPELAGLGKINVSVLNSDQYDVLDKFCSAIVEDKNIEPYISVNSFYTVVLFNYDLVQEAFKFSSYIAGEPFFEDDENIECPVRFFYNEDNAEYFDVNIFLKLENEKWVISQIVYDID